MTPGSRRRASRVIKVIHDGHLGTVQKQLRILGRNSNLIEEAAESAALRAIEN